MDTLEKIAPLLDTVGLTISLRKKDGLIYMGLLPNSSADGQPEDLYSRLSPIVLSGTLEELLSATFDEGFAVAKTVALKVAGATEALAQADALETAAKNKAANAAKVSQKTAPSSGSTSAQPLKAGTDVVTAKASEKPALNNTKYHQILAMASINWSGVEKAQKELAAWKATEEQLAHLTAVFEKNKDKGRPGLQTSLV